jgi:hypothetical protein
MKRFLAMMLMMLAMPMLASATVLLDEDFDGGVGTPVAGWSDGAWLRDSNTIDAGNSYVAGNVGPNAFLINHVLSAPSEQQYYQIEFVLQGLGTAANDDAAYFNVYGADGRSVTVVNSEKWADEIEFQSAGGPGPNWQWLDPTDLATPGPQTIRLNTYADRTELLFNPPGGNWDLAPSAPDGITTWGLTDIQRIELSVHGGNGQSFYDSISVRVVPEPASMGLMVLGGLAMLRRRRSA